MTCEVVQRVFKHALPWYQLEKIRARRRSLLLDAPSTTVTKATGRGLCRDAVGETRQDFALAFVLLVSRRAGKVEDFTDL